jgi:hypothetical protein
LGRTERYIHSFNSLACVHGTWPFTLKTSIKGSANLNIIGHQSVIHKIITAVDSSTIAWEGNGGGAKYLEKHSMLGMGQTIATEVVHSKELLMQSPTKVKPLT